MPALLSFFQNTLGQKIIVALTGLALCGFVLIHMLGNLFILSGSEAYNNYAHSLHKIPLVEFMEQGLFVIFFIHIFFSVILLIRNKKAKGRSAQSLIQNSEKTTSFTHKFLWFQALVLSVFLVAHLWFFKFGVYYKTLLENGEMVRDIYRLIVESFKQPVYVLAYTGVLLTLNIHLFRGFPGIWKSFGFSKWSYSYFLKIITWLFSFVISLGFLIPIWYVFLFL